ncbi:rhodanese-like domain-containing protein [Pseudodesulfovibrio indicus]|uniref:Sulfurtransferase n=1 Tax=Pseudodesulfovibrio indicus TaxID=1716143 RepID=A0A126QPI7_9BACT|nr:rhodanese-like domain-containing protein [Pseudodesulfovibrio indicus]AMK11365.1 sulfurtransferase [Pseudodesulfovibrio indicus]TDT89752.1 rhodanese-related sulfurtransferase [Pseudodesulfovibrio indicus]
MSTISQMTPDQARRFMEAGKPDAYTLLDVRQDWEYEEDHLPGALHIPLPELPDRIQELDPEGTLLVYCASGGRSMAAAALLEGQGFEDINNLVGGMSAWEGHSAFGPMELGLVAYTGAESPAEVLLKAYAMEDALQIFYVERADMAETMERIQLFMELAGFEDKHKDTLYELYTRVVDEPMSRDEFEETALRNLAEEVEGGVPIGEFLDQFPGAFDDDQGVLQLASMVEAQALDYYLRCVRRSKVEETRKVLQILAREEKAHLKVLGKHMDRRE